jgi:sulfite reductase alpha subunit-like flavoprotein
MTKKCFGLIDIITNFNIKLDVGEFLSIATRIVPRLYTIASSYLVNPKQITLVVAIEYAEINGQQVKYGLASQYFINLKQQFDSGKTVKARMLFQPSNFTLPTKKNTPVRIHFSC